MSSAQKLLDSFYNSLDNPYDHHRIAEGLESLIILVCENSDKTLKKKQSYISYLQQIIHSNEKKINTKDNKIISLQEHISIYNSVLQQHNLTHSFKNSLKKHRIQKQKTTLPDKDRMLSLRPRSNKINYHDSLK